MNHPEPQPVDTLREIGPAHGSAWRAAEADGFDMSLVELSLKRSVWERMLDHDEALAFALTLRQAMRAAHAKA